MTNQAVRSKIQFRVSTLLWLMLAVCCFFAGRYSNDTQVENTAIQVPIGGSHVIDMNDSIPKFLVEDSAVCSAKRLSKESIQIDGISSGVSDIIVADNFGSSTIFTVIVK